MTDEPAAGVPAPVSPFMALVINSKTPLAIMANGLGMALQAAMVQMPQCAGLPDEVKRTLVLKAMAAAFGEIMSEATASPVVKLTLDMRTNIMDAFRQALKERVPALPSVPAGAMPPAPKPQA